MQKQPTYTYLEFLHHIKICDADTLMVLIELLAEEAKLYTRIEAEYLYANIWLAVNRFKEYRVINFFKLLNNH